MNIACPLRFDTALRLLMARDFVGLHQAMLLLMCASHLSRYYRHKSRDLDLLTLTKPGLVEAGHRASVRQRHRLQLREMSSHVEARWSLPRPPRTEVVCRFEPSLGRTSPTKSSLRFAHLLYAPPKCTERSHMSR